MSARVIRNTKILGKERVYGDVLTDEEIARIPPRSLDALIGSHTIDMNGAESNLGKAVGFSGSDQNVARLQASVDRLTSVVEALVGSKMSDIDLKTFGKDEIILEGSFEEEIIPEEIVEVPPQTVEAKPRAKNARSKAKPKAKPKAKVKPSAVAYKKGQTISFVGEDNKTLKGVIASVNKTRKIVTATVGEDTWEIGFADIK